jgi:hypothetical protein
MANWPMASAQGLQLTGNLQLAGTGRGGGRDGGQWGTMGMLAALEAT